MNPDFVPQPVNSQKPDTEVNVSVESRRGFLQRLSAVVLVNSAAGKLGASLVTENPTQSITS
jgi:hypothetical protein